MPCSTHSAADLDSDQSSFRKMRTAILNLYSWHGRSSTCADSRSSGFGSSLVMEILQHREGAGRIRPQDLSTHASDSDSDAVNWNPLYRDGCLLFNCFARAQKLVGAVLVPRFRSAADICLSP